MRAQPPVPCFGVGCEMHQDCLRYALIEGSKTQQTRIGYCGRAGDRPLFLAVAPPERKPP
jgi:hypothetical protein